MKTLEQQYAEKVFEKVKVYKDSPNRDQYAAMAQELPILIRTAGLAEALAFTNSRKENPPKDLLDHLSDVLGYTNREALLERSRAAGMQEYIYLTRCSMLALKWFKRFAQSELGS
ncbi:MAG: type III-B CRISPR module-associated protein Cmr5 [Chloroflexota bacterium]